ncbi:MAG: DegT/DnrJ/EryC1/StrS aminotransferase family protein [Planctomycetota bacterium]
MSLEHDPTIPSIDSRDVDAVRRVLQAGEMGPGRWNEEFESAFAEYLGVRGAVSLASGAAALQLALEAFGVDGEVILPSLNHVDATLAVLRAGATPIFADVDSRSFTVDPDAVASRIGPRTEAIIPAHVAGQCCDMTRLTMLSERHGLLLLEDSTDAVGGMHFGQQAGSFGPACFSFATDQNLATGQGGLFACDDLRVIAEMRALSDRGRIHGRVTRVGTDLRMSGLEAALGLQRLDRVDGLNEQRRSHAAAYDEAFQNFDEVRPPVVLEGSHHVYQRYPVRVRNLDRDRWLERLREAGVAAVAAFDPPVHQEPAFMAFDPNQELPRTEEVARGVVTLPLGPGLTNERRDAVIEAVELTVVECRTTSATEVLQ